MSARRRRVIYVGHVGYRALPCPRCPGGAMIYPATALPAHLARHDLPLIERNCAGPRVVQARYRGGRTPGSENKTTVSGRGVEKKNGIRRAR